MLAPLPFPNPNIKKSPGNTGIIPEAAAKNVVVPFVVRDD
jgi:hypothetical protein